MKIGKVQKLVPNLKNKKTYVVHMKNLDPALKHGLRLKKVHRVIRFEQSYWRYSNADLKISLYIHINIKAIPGKFCILDRKNYRVIHP